MGAPVNVKLEKPSVTIEKWDDQAAKWIALNTSIRGNPGFYPLTIKAAYVIGVIHDICECVSLLLNAPDVKVTFIPAYGVFASGVELLGRCINGNSSDKGSTADLVAGFQQLEPSAKVDTDVIVETSKHAYTRGELVALRHFAAHGQAVSKIGPATTYEFSIDTELPRRLPDLLAGGLGRYWADLQSNADLCNQLAKANVIQLRDWPVFNMWTYFEDYSVDDMFAKFKSEWKI